MVGGHVLCYKMGLNALKLYISVRAEPTERIRNTDAFHSHSLEKAGNGLLIRVCFLFKYYI